MYNIVDTLNAKTKLRVEDAATGTTWDYVRADVYACAVAERDALGADSGMIMRMRICDANAARAEQAEAERDATAARENALLKLLVAVRPYVTASGTNDLLAQIDSVLAADTARDDRGITWDRDAAIAKLYQLAQEGA